MSAHRTTVVLSPLTSTETAELRHAIEVVNRYKERALFASGTTPGNGWTTWTGIEYRVLADSVNVDIHQGQVE